MLESRLSMLEEIVRNGIGTPPSSNSTRSESDQIRNQRRSVTRYEPPPTSRNSLDNGNSRRSSMGARIPGAGVWSESETRSRTRTTRSSQSSRIPTESSAATRRNGIRNTIRYRSGVDSPVSFGRVSNSGSSDIAFP